MKTIQYIVSITALSWESKHCKAKLVFDSIPTQAAILSKCGDYQRGSVIVRGVKEVTTTVRERSITPFEHLIK